jgi:phosphohistidine phosphatase
MKLYFLRHGIAYERETWQGDNDEFRPLTDDGIAAMKREAKSFERLKLKLDVIITSPLVRARDTARIVAKRLDLKILESDLLKPGFSIQMLEKLTTDYPQHSNLMLVGHEPDFSRVISTVIGGGYIVLKKGGLARVDITAQQPLRGELVWLQNWVLSKKGKLKRLS